MVAILEIVMAESLVQMAVLECKIYSHKIGWETNRETKYLRKKEKENKDRNKRECNKLELEEID